MSLTTARVRSIYQMPRAEAIDEKEGRWDKGPAGR